MFDSRLCLEDRTILRLPGLPALMANGFLLISVEKILTTS